MPCGETPIVYWNSIHPVSIFLLPLSCAHQPGMHVLWAVVLIGLAHGGFAKRVCQNVEMVYEYKALAYNGIPGTSANVSGVETNITFLLKSFTQSNRFELKIEKCSSAPLQNLSAKHTKLCDKLKEQPLPFDMTNGYVTGLYPDPTESEMILNLKRGIVSALQVKSEGEDNTHVINEVDVLGRCETEIVRSHLEDEVEVLKRRATEKCDGRLKHTIIAPSQNQEAKFAYGTVTALYRLKKDGTIKLAELIQDEELAPLTKEGGHVLTHINQTFWLVGSRYICDEPTPVMERQTASLPFNYNFASEESPISNPSTTEIIDQIVEAESKGIPNLFLELVPAMRTLSLNMLREINDDLKQSDKKHSVFLDALPFVYTEEAVEFIVELTTHSEYILSNARKTALALSLAAAPVQHRNPCKLLTQALTLAKNRDTCQSTTLTLGIVINRVREYNPRICNSEVNPAIEYLLGKIEINVNKLPASYNPSKYPDHAQYKTYWEQALHAIKALGNAGVPQSILKLEECIEEKRLLIEGRIAAINALQRIAEKTPLKVRELTLRLYRTSSKEDEIRTTAFTVFMENLHYGLIPSYQMRWALEQVTREPETSEVKSYVCSYLKTLRKSHDPAYRKLRASVFYYEKWTNALVTCNNSSHSVFSSHSFHWYKSLADMVKPLSRDIMGASLSLDYISTNASRIPRFIKSKLSAHLFGYDMDVLEASIRTTGVEKLVCSFLLGSNGHLRLGSFAEGYDLLCGNHVENTSVSVDLKAMGDELLWKNFRPGTTATKVNSFRNRVADLFAKAGSLRREIVSFIKYLLKGEFLIYDGKVDLNKTAGFLDVRRVVPTIIGIPINLAISAAAHVQFDSSIHMEYTNNHPILSTVGIKWLTELFFGKPEETVEVHMDIRPKLSVAAKVEVILDDYQYKPKLVFIAKSSSNFSQRISALMYGDYTTNVTIYEMPENETVLFNASYAQFAEVNGVSQKLEIEDQKEKSAYIKAYDLIGLDLCANVNYASTNGHPMATLLPPAGPANMAVSLKRPNANLTMMVFSFRKSDLKLKSFSARASLVAVGINRSIDSSLLWEAANGAFVLNGALSSFLANSSTLVVVNTSSHFTIESIFNFNSSLANFTAGLGLNSTNINANSSLVVGKHRIYLAEMKASRHSFRHGNLSFNIFVGNQKSPHSLNMTVLLRKWYANITGQLWLSGKRKPHVLIIGGSFGKYFANFTGLFHMDGHCAPYQMAFSGSYINGNASGWAMINLPDVLKRHDVYLSAAVGKWFTNASAAIYQHDRKNPHRINVKSSVVKGFVYMSGSLAKAGHSESHRLTTETKLSYWSITSLTRLQLAKHPENKLNITGGFDKGRVTGLVTLDTRALFKLYKEPNLPKNKLKWFLARISSILHQPSKQPHQVRVNGTLNKWYSNVSVFVHMARDKLPHYLNFNGSFAKWYINGTAMLLPKGDTVPHRVHLSGNMGKWFLNGSAFFHKANDTRPYRFNLNGSVGKLWINGTASYHHASDEQPYQVCLNGSVGKLWVNGSACFQMPQDKKPHHATLKGAVGKWFMNMSSTVDLQLNSAGWNKHYFESNMSLAGRTIKVSTNSSLLGLAAVKKFLRISGSQDKAAPKQQIEPTAKPLKEFECMVLEKRIRIHIGEMRCKSSKTHRMCSDGCEAVYDSDRNQPEKFRCTNRHKPIDSELANTSFINLEVASFKGCKKMKL